MPLNEILSPAEERFERWRRQVGLVVGPVVFLLLLFLPNPSLSTEARRLTAVLALVLIFWLTEAIPIPATALLGAVLSTLLGIAPAREVFAPFADPIVFLFIGSFILAEGIAFHGLDRRFAFRLLSFRWVKGSPARVLLVVGLATALLSMWVSNSATTAMMLPIALGILHAMREIHGGTGDTPRAAGRSYATGMMLMIAYSASIGGLATPVGSPPNLIGIGLIRNLAGVSISFLEWMAVSLPLVALMFLFLFLLLRRLHPPEVRDLPGARGYLIEARRRLGKWGRGEVQTLIAFLVAILLWVGPSLVASILGKEAPLSTSLLNRFDEGAVALFAALLLFLLPVNLRKGEFTLPWERVLRIDWGTILLFGGGLSLGRLLFSTGLAEAVGKGLAGLPGTGGLWGLTAVGIGFGILLTETISNTAAANMTVPIMIALAKSIGVSPIPPALGACLGSSLAFMLPVSTPPNAIVYGSGRLSVLTMLRAGVLFDLIGFFVIWGGLRILCPLMGWV